MNMQNFQNLLAPVERPHHDNANPAQAIPVEVTRLIDNTLRRLHALFTSIDEKRRAAYENRKAIEHLESLTDEQLRDIGIDRYDIEYRVRAGRDTI